MMQRSLIRTATVTAGPGKSVSISLSVTRIAPGFQQALVTPPAASGTLSPPEVLRSHCHQRKPEGQRIKPKIDALALRSDGILISVFRTCL